MKPITFIYSHDNIFQGVKQESSLLAVRKTDKDGNGMFEQLVFDEAYETKFRELFFDAQSKVTAAVSAYLREIPVDPEYFETQDFTKNRDYSFYLIMPDNFNFHLVRSIDIDLKQFLISYILYRWLETKLPNDAAMFFDRASTALAEARSHLNVRVGRITRWSGLW